MKLYIRTDTGRQQIPLVSDKIYVETESGTFTITEKLHGDTYRTFISVDETLGIFPRASNIDAEKG